MTDKNQIRRDPESQKRRDRSRANKYNENNLLGFANYCLELDILIPTNQDITSYYKQGGWKYYAKHIESGRTI